jgi:O-antigen/teichoic acid export membrane protein
VQVFKQWPLYFIGRLLPAAIGFGAIALYTRLLDPASFGVYALLLSTLYLVGMVGYSWLRVATLRMMAAVDPAENADYIATIALAFGGVSVLVAATVIVSLRIFEPSLPLSLELLAAGAAVAGNWFEINVAISISRIKLLAYGLLQAGRAIAALLATLLLIWAGLRAQALLGGYLIGNLAAFGAFGIWKPAFRGRVRWDLFVKMVRFGWPSSASSLSYCITTAQRYLLQIAGGSAAVGVFAAAGDFSTQTIGLLIGTATLAGQPLAFRARDLGHHDRLRDQLRNNARLTFAVGLPAAAGVIALAGPVTHVYFGAQFRSGAAVVMSITATFIFLGGLRGSFFEQAFEIVMDTRPLVALMILRIILCLVPSVLLIPRFGAAGAAGSLLISEIVTTTLSGVWAMRVIDLRIPFASLARIIAATGAMVCAIESVPHRDCAVGLGISIAAGIAVYGATLGLLHAGQLRSLLRTQPAGLPAVGRV